MSEPPREFFTGNSLEQAVLTAAQHYGVEPDDLAYERVERRYGFLRVRRNVVIKVDPQRPVRKRRPGVSESALPPPPDAEVEEPSGPETQHDFNLHREPPRTAVDRVPQRAPGAGGGQGRGGGGGRRGSGRERGREQHGQRGFGQRGQGGGQRGQGGGQRGHGGGQRAEGWQRSERGGFQGQGGAPAGAAEGGGQGGGRRRRRRRGGGGGGGGGQGGPDRERRAPQGPVLEFVPRERDLPRAEGEAAELAASTAGRLAALAGLDVEVEVFQGETELEVELHGPDQELLFEDEGRLLLAIQHLLPRSMQGEISEGTGVRVDSQGFRSQRVEGLERLAREAAEEVRRRGRPKTLQSMNPSDRRTVHMALKDTEGVITESSGDGFYKRITVRPV
jgi:predicted RNA-binding protein Jag